MRLPLKLNTLIFFIFLLIFVFSTDAIAQNDTIREKWFRNYYTKYLDRVLKKEQHNYIPHNGVVPDSETAIEIAIVILSKVYGKEIIEKEKLFSAILIDGHWIVYGNFPSNNVVGGVAEIVIRKRNGEVINISHGK